jgi:hypothetical protein
MSTPRIQPDTGTAPTNYPQARPPIPKPQVTTSTTTHSTIPVQLSNYLRLHEISGTSRTSASPNPPATSSHNSTNQSQRSSDSAQHNGKGQHHGHANSSNKEHQPQTITFTGHAERNDHREEAQRVAAEASFTPAPTGSQKEQNFHHQKFQDAQGSLDDSTRNGKNPRTEEYASQASPSKDKTAKMGQHSKTVKNDPNDDHATPPARLRPNSVLKQGTNSGHLDARKTQPDSDDERRNWNFSTLLTNVAVHQRPKATLADFPLSNSASKLSSQVSSALQPAHRSTMGGFIGKSLSKSLSDLRPGKPDHGKSPPEFRPGKPDHTTASQDAGPRQDLDGNQLCQIMPTNQVHAYGAHGNETTFAASYNLGPQVTRDFTPSKHALNATNRLSGKFVSVTSWASVPWIVSELTVPTSACWKLAVLWDSELPDDADLAHQPTGKTTVRAHRALTCLVTSRLPLSHPLDWCDLPSNREYIETVDLATAFYQIPIAFMDPSSYDWSDLPTETSFTVTSKQTEQTLLEAVSAADEHHPKIAQERSVPPVFTPLQRGSVGVRTMPSGSTLVNQTNQSHWFKSTKPFEPGPPSPISSVIQQSGHVHLELHDGANSQISLLPWYTCITAQYQLLPASLLYHAGKGTNVNGRQSPSLTANLEEATSINWGPPEHCNATLHRPAVQRTSKTDRDEKQSNRGPAYVTLARPSGRHTQLLDSASALRFALSLFLLVATPMFRCSLRYASLCLCNFDVPLQVALYVSNLTNDGAIKPRKIASAVNLLGNLARKRPQHISTIVPALMKHATTPPTILETRNSNLNSKLETRN